MATFTREQVFEVTIDQANVIAWRQLKQSDELLVAADWLEERDALEQANVLRRAIDQQPISGLEAKHLLKVLETQNSCL